MSRIIKMDLNSGYNELVKQGYVRSKSKVSLKWQIEVCQLASVLQCIFITSWRQRYKMNTIGVTGMVTEKATSTDMSFNFSHNKLDVLLTLWWPFSKVPFINHRLKSINKWHDSSSPIILINLCSGLWYINKWHDLATIL